MAASAHKASLERVLQSTLKNKKAGSEVATSIMAVEALVVSGIDETAMVENTDVRVVGRIRAALCHKAYGKRLADAISTIDSIIAAEAIVVVAEDTIVSPSTNKQGLRKICIDEMARKDVGLMVADMVSKVEKAIDLLLVEYGVGGAKEDAPTEAALEAIKAILVS
jgi:hypothetical protein